MPPTPPALTRYGVRLVACDSRYDISKAQNELGYRPLLTFRQGIATLIPPDEEAMNHATSSSAAATIPADNIRIESLGVYLPEKILTMEELLASCRRRPRWDLERITGIHERRVAVGEYAVDLGIKAARQALAMSCYRAEELDVIVCTQHFQVQPGKRISPGTGHRRAHPRRHRRRECPRVSTWSMPAPACSPAFMCCRG